jgi:agmatine deiminase
MLKSFTTFMLGFLMAGFSLSQPLNPFTPPEYAPAKAVLIEWDFNQYTWDLYSTLIMECSEAATVIMVVNGQDEEMMISQQLIGDSVPMENIEFVHVSCEPRIWIRDHGPLAVFSGDAAVYIDLDDLANSGLSEDLPVKLANAWGLDSYGLPYVFCGGNFMVDGHHTLFTTTRLYSNNPAYPPATIDADFSSYFGINNIVTVSAQHNDYWGHIDMQMKLLDDTTIVISSVDSWSGPNYDTLENNYARIAALTAPNGKSYRIERLPMAENWKTYTNSLILNDKVLVPVYNHPLDSVAIDTYQQLMPGHEIVGINCNKIIGWEGALHCITMQLFDEDLLTAVQEQEAFPGDLRAYPNPVDQGQEFHVQYTGDGSSNRVLRIYDANGMLVYSAMPRSDGSYSIRWHFPAGLYFLAVKTPGGNISRQVIGR